MKKILTLMLAVSCMTTVFAQQKKGNKSIAKTHTVAKVATPAAAAQGGSESKAPLEFKESTFSFGKIKQNVPVTHVFTFKNTSGAPVIIENASAQCGCTTPEYPKAPIAKGATEQIKVTYNAATVGSFTKQVTVRIAKQSEPIILTINGEVLAKEGDKKGK